MSLTPHFPRVYYTHLIEIEYHHVLLPHFPKYLPYTTLHNICYSWICYTHSNLAHSPTWRGDVLRAGKYLFSTVHILLFLLDLEMVWLDTVFTVNVSLILAGLLFIMLPITYPCYEWGEVR
jgi:hypothetical protein